MSCANYLSMELHSAPDQYYHIIPILKFPMLLPMHENYGFFNTFLLNALNSKFFPWNKYSKCSKKYFIRPSQTNLRSLEWNCLNIANCYAEDAIS